MTFIPPSSPPSSLKSGLHPPLHPPLQPAFIPPSSPVQQSPHTPLGDETPPLAAGRIPKPTKKNRRALNVQTYSTRGKPPHAENRSTAWRRLSRIAEIAPRLLGDDGRWLADAIEKRLTGEVKSLDTALGITKRGGVSVKVERTNDVRNRLICEYASRFLAKETKPERALFFALTEFETRQWPRLSVRAVCPPHLEGTASGLLFELFKLRCRIPGSRQLRTILNKMEIQYPI